jgi:hypothetical protein
MPRLLPVSIFSLLSSRGGKSLVICAAWLGPPTASRLKASRWIGVEVDVLNHPEWIIKGQSGSPSEQRVLASQVTDGNGRFTFKGLPAGAYEVRFGKPMFEQQHLYVEVRPRTRRKKRLKIALGLAI